MTAEEKKSIQETLMWLENGDGLEIAKELKVSASTVHNVRYMRSKRVNVRILERLLKKAKENKTKIMTMIERNKQ